MSIKPFFKVLFGRGRLKWIFPHLLENVFMLTQNMHPQKYTKAGFWDYAINCKLTYAENFCVVGSHQNKNNTLKCLSVYDCESNEEFYVACVLSVFHPLIQLWYSKNEEMALNEELKGTTKQRMKSFFWFINTIFFVCNLVLPSTLLVLSWSSKWVLFSKIIMRNSFLFLFNF